ncbi:MAG: pre-peptidase C-terminal domain-containing protein [Gammaproteobacteria bacterium]
MSTVRTCYDKILPREVNRPQRMMSFGGRQRAVFQFRKMWITGSTLSVHFLEGSTSQKKLVKEQAAWWMDHANLFFDFNDDPDADIRITFDQTDGAWSYVGTDASSIPTPQPTMNLGFLDGGTAAHEFGHAIGLVHEHQNPEGGIEWNEDVVIRDLGGPPNNWDEATVRHNVLNKYSADQIRGTEFDPDSIMLYFFPDSWVKNGQGTKANEILSPLDKAFIASEDAYPSENNISDAIELPVINTSGVTANIGEPGEEDLFKFSVTKSARHVIETDGQTDVVMKLFGPNNETTLLAEDDDGGVGRNSRIATDLSPGEYFVQIRHYNSNSGTGDYNIKVMT